MLSEERRMDLRHGAYKCEWKKWGIQRDCPVVVRSMKAELINKVEKTLSKNNKIIVICQYDDIDLLYLFRKEITKREISHTLIWHCLREVENNDNEEYLSDTEMYDLLDLYRMYDFSDKIIVIADDLRYGGLHNYVKDGIITKDEMVTALLYKD